MHAYMYAYRTRTHTHTHTHTHTVYIAQDTAYIGIHARTHTQTHTHTAYIGSWAEGNGIRASEACDGAQTVGKAGLAIAGHCCDEVATCRHFAHAVVFSVCHEDVALPVQAHASRHSEARAHADAVDEPSGPIACHCADDTAARNLARAVGRGMIIKLRYAGVRVHERLEGSQQRSAPCVSRCSTCRPAARRRPGTR